jgi:hypothetical protein
MDTMTTTATAARNWYQVFAVVGGRRRYLGDFSGTTEAEACSRAQVAHPTVKKLEAEFWGRC